MAVIPSQEDIRIMQQSVHNQFIKVDLLNFDMQTVDSLEGSVVEGSINIDADSDIRRNCNITLTASNANLEIDEGGKIWLDKYIKIYEGITDNKTKEIHWDTMGTFIINNPNRVYNSTTNTINFEGLDLMAKLTTRRNGQSLGVTTVIPAGTLLADAMKDTLTQLGGFKKYVIEKGYDSDNNEYTIPYDIQIDATGTVYDLMATMRDLYANWEMFFDVDGVFHFQPIPSGVDSPVVLDFTSLDKNLIISDSINVNFEDVKNRIIVYGRLLDNGHQVRGLAADYYEDSPYNINKLGQLNYVVTDERIYSDSLAKTRADYELYLHSRLNDAILLETIPIFWLNDVNVKIKYISKNSGISGEYLIKSLSIPLGVGESMTINAMKVYDPSTQISTIESPVISITGRKVVYSQTNPYSVHVEIFGEGILSTITLSDIMVNTGTLPNYTIVKTNENNYDIIFENSVWGTYFSFYVKEGVALNVEGTPNPNSNIFQINSVEPDFYAWFQPDYSEEQGETYIDWGNNFNFNNISVTQPFILSADVGVYGSNSFGQISHKSAYSNGRVEFYYTVDGYDDPFLVSFVVVSPTGSSQIFTVEFPPSSGGNELWNGFFIRITLRTTDGLNFTIKVENSFTGYDVEQTATFTTNVQGINDGTFTSQLGNSTYVSPSFYRYEFAGVDANNNYHHSIYTLYDNILTNNVTDINNAPLSKQVNGVVKNGGIIQTNAKLPEVITPNPAYRFYYSGYPESYDCYNLLITQDTGEAINNKYINLNEQSLFFDETKYALKEFLPIENDASKVIAYMARLQAIENTNSSVSISKDVVVNQTLNASSPEVNVPLMAKRNYSGDPTNSGVENYLWEYLWGLNVSQTISNNSLIEIDSTLNMPVIGLSSPYNTRTFYLYVFMNNITGLSSVPILTENDFNIPTGLINTITIGAPEDASYSWYENLYRYQITITFYSPTFRNDTRVGYFQVKEGALDYVSKQGKNVPYPASPVFMIRS